METVSFDAIADISKRGTLSPYWSAGVLIRITQELHAQRVRAIKTGGPTYFHECQHFVGYTPESNYKCPKCSAVSASREQEQT